MSRSTLGMGGGSLGRSKVRGGGPKVCRKSGGSFWGCLNDVSSCDLAVIRFSSLVIFYVLNRVRQKRESRVVGVEGRVENTRLLRSWTS